MGIGGSLLVERISSQRSKPLSAPTTTSVSTRSGGSCQMCCIALRTLVMQGQTAYVQAGAGIVADSVPEKEYEETLSKAQGLLKAIEIAEMQL